LKKSSGDCLKLAKYVIQHSSEMMLFLYYCIISVRCGGKLQHPLITCFLGNTCAKRYENLTMHLELQLKTSGMYFETQCIFVTKIKSNTTNNDIP